MADHETDTILWMALRALNERTMQWLTLAMSFGLYCLAGYSYSHGRLAVASVFTLLVHLPLAFKKGTSP